MCDNQNKTAESFYATRLSQPASGGHRKQFFCQDDHRYNWIPINPFHSYSSFVSGSRTQYPIRLAYASTIHKSQGQTMEK
jgi:hypothetical protein